MSRDVFSIIVVKHIRFLFLVTCNDLSRPDKVDHLCVCLSYDINRLYGISKGTNVTIKTYTVINVVILNVFPIYFIGAEFIYSYNR